MLIFRRSHWNPLLNLTPEKLRHYLDLFDMGYVRYAAITWDFMMRTDDTLPSVADKRKKSVSGMEWTIEAKDETPEAKRQAECLKFAYDHISATNAYDENQRGGVAQLIMQCLDALGVHYSVHELIWKPTASMTPLGAPQVLLEARFVPLWFFENRRGRLRYMPVEGQIEGIELEPDGWIVCASHRALMRPCSVAYMFKHLPLHDWLIYCERYGMPAFLGKTDAAPGSEQWEADKQALESLAAEFAGLSTRDTEIEILDLSVKGELAFPKLIERMDRAFTVLWRGADLSTLSRDNAAGASLQSGEANLLEEDDAKWMSEVMNKQIDEPVLRYAFGEDVEIKAFFKLIPPDRKGMNEHRANLITAYNLQVPISLGEVYDRLGLQRPMDAADTLIKPAQAMDAPGGNAPAGVASANALEATEAFIDACADHGGHAVADDFAPLRAEMQAIADLSDPGVQRARLIRFRQELPGHMRRMAQHGRLSGALADILATSLANGMSPGTKPRGQPTQTSMEKKAHV